MGVNLSRAGLLFSPLFPFLNIQSLNSANEVGLPELNDFVVGHGNLLCFFLKVLGRFDETRTRLLVRVRDGGVILTSLYNVSILPSKISNPLRMF